MGVQAITPGTGERTVRARMYVHVGDVPLNLSVEDVLRGQGVDPERASARLVDAATVAAEQASGLACPAALYKMVHVTDFEHQRVSFDGGAFEGPLVARAMAGAQQVAIAVCTIGEALERRAEQAMRTNAAAALALDGAGTAALRKVSQAVETRIKDEYGKLCLEPGMRVQPGQEGWPIEQQAQVFRLLPVARIGVLLTRDFLMRPKKSVSFALPGGSGLDAQAVPCDLCSKRDRCGWRREGSLDGNAASLCVGDATVD